MSSKYRGKLKALRRHLKEINGVPTISRKWTVAYLSDKELKMFEKKFQWRRLLSTCICKECGVSHLNPKKYKRYAYWWDIEKFLQGD